jgi:hypothetical protein
MPSSAATSGSYFVSQRTGYRSEGVTPAAESAGSSGYVASPFAAPRSTARPSWFGHLTSRSLASGWYVVPMLLAIVVSVALMELEFGRAALPPGVDPGHWLSTSYAYVGLPTAPDPANNVLFYSPLMFPFLGGLVRLTGSPIFAADIFAGMLLFLYGLTVLHLARRFLLSGPLQLALVGLEMFCGTTWQMLFWGGYPNFLGFIGFNESVIFFTLFARSRQSRDATLFYLAVGLTFLAHDLSFAVLVAALLLALAFLLLFGRLDAKFLADWRNLVGIAGTIGLLVTYRAIGAWQGISGPSYFYSNPAAFKIDEIGEIFVPLGHAPAFFPVGPTVVLAPAVATGLLLFLPLLILLSFSVVMYLWPQHLDSRLIVAGAWLGAAAVVPALGYLAGIETDYTRFLFFLPLPLALLLVTALDRALLPYLIEIPSPAPPPRHRASVTYWTPPAPSGAPWPRARPVPTAFAGVVVVLLLILLFSTVTLPVAVTSERTGASVAHDSLFLSANRWIAQNGVPGNILTVPTGARWSEALTNRATFDVGPVWLLFDPFQINWTEQTYWAVRSEYAVSDGSVALSYSGFATQAMLQSPLYTVYDEGIPFPVFRVVPNAFFSVNASNGATQGQFPAISGVVPSLRVPGDVPNGGTSVYTGSASSITETSWVGPNAQATFSFVVTPRSGWSVSSIQLPLAVPPGASAEFGHDRPTNVTFAHGTLQWNVTGPLGQYPYPKTIPTTLQFSDTPTAQTLAKEQGVLTWIATFPDPNGSRPFRFTLVATSSDATNPVGGLPPLFSTTAFLAAHNVRLILWPNGAYDLPQQQYFESSFGFKLAYQNPEWAVLEL